jgi:hypothetical protein
MPPAPFTVVVFEDAQDKVSVVLRPNHGRERQGRKREKEPQPEEGHEG